MKDLLLIVNPNAGRNGYRDCLSDVLYTFHKCDWRTTVAFTNGHGDATGIVAEASRYFSRIVCMGGDGTLSETISGMMRLPPEKRPEIAYIPMGTSNDSATTLGLSRDPVLAAYTAATGQTIPIDVGRFNNDRFFSYVAAFGAFTEVSYETPQDQKNSLGWLAYAFDAMSRLPNLTHRRCRIEFDSGAVEDDFILCAVTNARRFAGFIRLDNTSGVSLSDGLFEAILVRTPETILKVGPTFSDIMANNYDSEYVSLVHSRRIKFTFEEPVAWSLDGEDGGRQTEVVCDNVYHAIRMVVNEDM
mgnify:CR=1 FL=1